MGRVINPASASKERHELSMAVIVAIRELMQQTQVDDHTRDLASFISVTLESIHKSIDVSVVAWEKRGYWVKADRFRLEWAWSERLGNEMRTAVLNEDWESVARVATQIAVKLQSVTVPQRNRIGMPWVGAWEKLLREGG